MMTLPFLFDKRWKSGVFPMQKQPAAPYGKSYSPYAEKSSQAVFSPVLNPNSRTFCNGDNADRTPPSPGSSACRGRRSFYRACCPFSPRKNAHSRRHFLLLLIDHYAPGPHGRGVPSPGACVPNTPALRPPASPGWRAFSPARSVQRPPLPFPLPHHGGRY